MNSLLVLYGVTLLSRERLCKSISNTWTQFLNLWCNSCEEVALLKIQELLDFHKWNTKRLYFSTFPSDASWIWHSKSTKHFPVREHCQSLICPVTYTSISAWFDGCDLNHVQQTANIWTSVFLCDVLAMIRTLFTQLPLSPRSHFNIYSAGFWTHWSMPFYTSICLCCLACFDSLLRDISISRFVGSLCPFFFFLNCCSSAGSLPISDGSHSSGHDLHSEIT